MLHAVSMDDENPNDVDADSDLESLLADFSSIPLSPPIAKRAQQLETHQTLRSETELRSSRTVLPTQRSEMTNHASCLNTLERVVPPLEKLSRIITAFSSLPTKTLFEAESFESRPEENPVRVYQPFIGTLKKHSIQEDKPQSLAVARRPQNGPGRYGWTTKNPRYCQLGAASQHEPKACPVRFPTFSVPCPSACPWSTFSLRASNDAPIFQEDGLESTTTPSTIQCGEHTTAFAEASTRCTCMRARRKEHEEGEGQQEKNPSQHTENISQACPLRPRNLVRQQELCVQDQRERFDSSDNICSNGTAGRRGAETQSRHRSSVITTRPAGVTGRTLMCKRDCQQEIQSYTSNSTAKISREENVPLPNREVQHPTAAQACTDTELCVVITREDTLCGALAVERTDSHNFAEESSPELETCVAVGNMKSSKVAQIMEVPSRYRCAMSLHQRVDCTADFVYGSCTPAKQERSRRSLYRVGEEGLSRIFSVAHSSFPAVSPNRLLPCRGCGVATFLSEGDKCDHPLGTKKNCLPTK